MRWMIAVLAGLVAGQCLGGETVTFTVSAEVRPQPGEWYKVKGYPAHELVVISATWCGPCKQLWQTIERIAPFKNKLGWAATQVIYDEPQNAAFMARHPVNSFPTLLLFRRGRVIQRDVGAKEEDELTRWVKRGMEAKDAPRAADAPTAQP